MGLPQSNSFDFTLNTVNTEIAGFFLELNMKISKFVSLVQEMNRASNIFFTNFSATSFSIFKTFLSVCPDVHVYIFFLNGMNSDKVP